MPWNKLLTEGANGFNLLPLISDAVGDTGDLGRNQLPANRNRTGLKFQDRKRDERKNTP